jgi:hypothetical protein
MFTYYAIHGINQGDVRKFLLGRYTTSEKNNRVKNLGWLINNWKSCDPSKQILIWTEVIVGKNNLLMQVPLVRNHEQGYYISNWESHSILLNWLNRPIFRGLIIHDTTQEPHLIFKYDYKGMVEFTTLP